MEKNQQKTQRTNVRTRDSLLCYTTNKQSETLRVVFHSFFAHFSKGCQVCTRVELELDHFSPSQFAGRRSKQQTMQKGDSEAPFSFGDFLLSVSMPKQVSFKSKSLAVLQYGSFCAVLAYIFLYSIAVNHSYLNKQPANVLAQSYSIHNQTSYLGRLPPPPTFYCYNTSYDWPPHQSSGREIDFAGLCRLWARTNLFRFCF
jgi:hypothetical protein